MYAHGKKRSFIFQDSGQEPETYCMAKNALSFFKKVVAKNLKPIVYEYMGKLNDLLLGLHKKRKVRVISFN